MTLGWVEAQQGFDRTGLAGNTLHRSCFNTMVIELIILITSDITNFRSITNTSITISTNVFYATIIFIVLIELEWPAPPCIDLVPPKGKTKTKTRPDKTRKRESLHVILYPQTSHCSNPRAEPRCSKERKKGFNFVAKPELTAFLCCPLGKKVTEKSSP